MSDYEEFEENNQPVDLSSFDDEFASAEAPEHEEVPMVSTSPHRNGAIGEQPEGRSDDQVRLGSDVWFASRSSHL